MLKSRQSLMAYNDKTWILPHDDFGGFRLATSTLTGNDDASVVAGPLHRLVRRLGDGEDVRSPLVDFATLKMGFQHVQILFTNPDYVTVNRELLLMDGQTI